MTLDDISIATEGYVCGTGPEPIAIATMGYVCSSTEFEVPAGGGSSSPIRRNVPAEWYELKGVTPEQLRARLEQEDEEIMAVIVAAMRYLQ